MTEHVELIDHWWVDGSETIIDPACKWFAACFNLATTTRYGPAGIVDGVATFGQIPICDRCNSKMEDMS